VAQVGILAQVKPLAATDTLLYTVKGQTATIATIVICNQGAATTFNLRFTNPTEETINTKQYTHFGTTTGAVANTTVFVSLGVQLGQGQSIYCLATLATLSFSVFGVEN
jgi:hypothetical protein